MEYALLLSRLDDWVTVHIVNRRFLPLWTSCNDKSPMHAHAQDYVLCSFIHLFIHSLLQFTSQSVSQTSQIIQWTVHIILLHSIYFNSQDFSISARIGLIWFGLFWLRERKCLFFQQFSVSSSVPSHTHIHLFFTTHTHVHTRTTSLLCAHIFMRPAFRPASSENIFFSLLRLISICVSNCNEIKHKWIYIVCDFGWCKQVTFSRFQTKQKLQKETILIIVINKYNLHWFLISKVSFSKQLHVLLYIVLFFSLPLFHLFVSSFFRYTLAWLLQSIFFSPPPSLSHSRTLWYWWLLMIQWNNLMHATWVRFIIIRTHEKKTIFSCLSFFTSKIGKETDQPFRYTK